LAATRVLDQAFGRYAIDLIAMGTNNMQSAHSDNLIVKV